MTRKIITGVIAAILVITIAVLAADKVKEKVLAERPKAGEGFERHEGLLDQLAEAYKANDREKMGEIINKMQERREKMVKSARFNRWRQWAHQRMMGPGFAPNYGAMQGMQMGPGWGHGQQMAGPGWNRGWAMRGRGWNQWNQGYPMAGPQWGQFQAMRGHGFGGYNNIMGNCGAMQGRNFGQMPCQQDGMGMGNFMPQQNGPAQMPGWGRRFQRERNHGPDEENMGQQEWNMPHREIRNNVPPPEWGW
jgi:hypothetical protein